MVQTMYTTFLWHDCQILIFSEIALWRERRLICDVSNFSGVINVDVWICDIWMCVSMYVCASVYVCACVYVCLCMCVWCTIDSHTWNRSKCIYSEARAPFLSNVYMYISKNVRVRACVWVCACVYVCACGNTSNTYKATTFTHTNKWTNPALEKTRSKPSQAKCVGVMCIDYTWRPLWNNRVSFTKEANQKRGQFKEPW